MTACQGAKGTGTKYTYAQLQGLWIQAGGPKSLAPTMAAIAEAESGGCSTAFNPSGATGLWQILGAVNPADQPGLTNPQTNAHEAVLKYRSQGLGAWVTYTSGAYKAFLAGGSPDMTGLGNAAPGAATASDVANPLTCAVKVPTLSTGKVLGIGLSTGPGACLLGKSEARSLIGAGVLLGGTTLALAGIIVLAAYGFGSSHGAAVVGAVAGSAGAFTGAGRVAAGAVDAGQARGQARRQRRVARRSPAAQPAGRSPSGP